MYTRYADDLSFSTRTREFPTRLARPVGGWTGSKVIVGDDLVKIIRDNGFELNDSKTRLQFRDLHQDVTGIVVNKAPNVRRSFIREIRAMIHAWDKFKLPAAEQRFHEKFEKRVRNPRRTKPSFRLVLKGKIDYLRMVRGESDAIYRRLRNRLHYLDPDLVKEVLPVMPKAGPIEQVWQHWAREYRDSVYLIEVRDQVSGKVSGGTAFATRRGFLCTAEHVLVGEVWIATPLSTKVPVNGVAVHPLAQQGLDIALLKVPIEPIKAPFLPISATLPEVGEPAAVLGFPGVPGRNPSFGIYPVRVESVTTDYKGNAFIQIGGDLAGGMSGGPLINSSGSVIGVVSEQTFEETGGTVRPRPFPQVLPITHLAKINVDELIDPAEYAAQRTNPLPHGLRKLLGFVEDVISP